MVLVNPNFVGIYVYAAQTQFSPAQQQLIVEWFSPDFHKLADVGAYELMLLLVPVVLLATGRRRLRPTDLLLLLVVTVLSLQSVRHIALFVAVATPLIVMEQVQQAWEAVVRARGPAPRAPDQHHHGP